MYRSCGATETDMIPERVVLHCLVAVVLKKERFFFSELTLKSLSAVHLLQVTIRFLSI